MIYLNNAATSYPKPACVQQAVSEALAAPPREGQRGMLGVVDIAEECRTALAPLLGVEDTERIFFTSGATESFNLILRGLPLQGKPLAATTAEHSALLRPLYALFCEEDIHILPYGENGILTPQLLADCLLPCTACVFINHCSNVTGAVQDISALARAAHDAGALFVADVSQSAGVLPINAQEADIDILVFTGHKGLFGPAGTGGFYLRPGLALRPAKWGGTGTEGDKVYPASPDLFEVGTQNLAGLAGLAAGANYAAGIGLDAASRRINSGISFLRHALGQVPGVRLYGGSPHPCGGAISFTIDGFSPADVGYILQHSYNIAVRTGHHCAPFMAQALGVPGGTVRASISYLNTDEELAALAAAVSEIAAAATEVPPCR